MNQGTAKVYPEDVQPIKGNNCGLIPVNPIALNMGVFGHSECSRANQYSPRLFVLVFAVKFLRLEAYFVNMCKHWRPSSDANDRRV